MKSVFKLRNVVARTISTLALVSASLLSSSNLMAVEFDLVLDRVQADMEAGSNMVAHVTVVLCTNRNKVTAICNEDNAKDNLYWGARWGVKTYFRKSKDWTTLPAPAAENPNIVDRALFVKKDPIGASNATLYILADVWRGGDARKATEHFLLMSSGENIEKFKVDDQTLYAGGEAHVTAYLGHNTLKKWSPDLKLRKNPMPSSAIVLGRHTTSFTPFIDQAGAFPLLTTKGVVTPEAYTLESAIIAWLTTTDPNKTLEQAAQTFADYQKANLSWTKSLFIAGVPE